MVGGVRRGENGAEAKWTRHVGYLPASRATTGANAAVSCGLDAQLRGDLSSRASSDPGPTSADRKYMGYAVDFGRIEAFEAQHFGRCLGICKRRGGLGHVGRA